MRAKEGNAGQQMIGTMAAPAPASLPYTVYVSGVAWRADMVRAADAPDTSGDPWSVFWNPDYRGRVGMYDGFLEALSLALLRDRVLDMHAATDRRRPGFGKVVADAVVAAQQCDVGDNIAGQNQAIGDAIDRAGLRADAEVAGRLRFDDAVLERLGRRYPRIAAKVNHNLAQLLAARVLNTQRALR